MTLLKQTSVPRADDNLTRLERDDDLQTDCCTFSLRSGSLEKELQTLSLGDTKASKSELSCESGIASLTRSAIYSIQSEQSDRTHHCSLPAKQSAPGSLKHVHTKTEPKCLTDEIRPSNNSENVVPSPADAKTTKEHRKHKEKVVGKVVHGWPDDDTFPDKDGDTLLHLAVLQTVTHLAQLVRVLGLRGQVNCRNRLYQTPLHLAVLTANRPAMACLRSLGASVCLQDCRGNTPLHTACLRNDALVLRLLLTGEGCVETNQDDRHEETPSEHGEGSECDGGVGRVSIKTVPDLLERHVPTTPHPSQRDGCGAPSGCEDPAESEEKTLTGVEDVDEAEEGGCWERQRRADREARVALCVKNYEGFTCLHLAVLHGNADLLALLLQHGADVNARDAKSGRTALHLAVDTPHPSSPILSSLLLHPHLLINATNFAQQTALQLARGRRHLDLVDLLHVRGARWSDGIHGYCSSDSVSEEDGDDDLFMPYGDLRVAGQLLTAARCSC